MTTLESPCSSQDSLRMILNFKNGKQRKKTDKCFLKNVVWEENLRKPRVPQILKTAEEAGSVAKLSASERTSIQEILTQKERQENQRVLLTMCCPDHSSICQYTCSWRHLSNTGRMLVGLGCASHSPISTVPGLALALPTEPLLLNFLSRLWTFILLLL